MQRVIDGDFGPPAPHLTSTMQYLKIWYTYINIFYSTTSSLYDRVRAAAHVLFFLRIWRGHIMQSPDLNLKQNFISRECYCDISLSCHFAVLLISTFRDHFPHLACLLNITGSDCCEVHFSGCGSWIQNRHSVTFDEMRLYQAHKNRLEDMRAAPDGPVVCRCFGDRTAFFSCVLGCFIQLLSDRLCMLCCFLFRSFRVGGDSKTTYGMAGMTVLLQLIYETTLRLPHNS